MKKPKHPGPYADKPPMGQYIKAMSKVAGHTVLPQIALPTPRRRRKQAPPRNHPNQQLHRQLLGDIVTHLRLHGWWVHLTQNRAAQIQGRFLKHKDNLKGMWDILAVKAWPDETIESNEVKSRVRKVWFEAKIPPDKLSEDQETFEYWMTATGDKCYVIRMMAELYPICGCASELNKIELDFK